MKKIAIIAALLLTSALTALSISHKENKQANVQVEKADFAAKSSMITPETTRLATAD